MEDTYLREAIQQAKAGKQRVILVVKGWRPMYQPNSTNGYGNYFRILPNHGDRNFTVREVCELEGIDPQTIQDTYFPEREPELSEAEAVEEFERRRQAVTNLFPFPTIQWVGGNDVGDPLELGTFTKQV